MSRSYHCMAQERDNFIKDGPYTCDVLMALSAKWDRYLESHMFNDGDVPLEKFSDEELVKLYESDRDAPMKFNNMFLYSLMGVKDMERLSSRQWTLLKDNGFNLLLLHVLAFGYKCIASAPQRIRWAFHHNAF